MPMPLFRSNTSLLTVDQVIEYVKAKTGAKVSRQGVHYWLKSGIKGVKLANIISTADGSIGRKVIRVRKDALDEFLHTVEISIKRA